MSEGYVKLHRKTLESGLLQMPNTFVLFSYILLKATHQNMKIGTPTGVIELKRGQFMSGRFKLSSALNQTEREIRTSLKRLTDLGVLTIKTTNKYSVYTIENYEKYQGNDQQDDQQTTSKEPTNDQQTTTKQEHKNIKTEELKTKAKKSNDFILPEWINKNHWDVWHETPKRKKATDGQKQMAVDKLLKMKEAGIDYALALENAAVGGYQGIFAPSQKSTPVNAKQSANKATTQAAYEKMFPNAMEREVAHESA